MWHSHLNDMEIPETKRFIPKGFELVQRRVSRIGLWTCLHRWFESQQPAMQAYFLGAKVWL